MNALRLRLTYANVMSTIAVFLALGGVTWAAVKLPKNSVGTAQLKASAVTGAKVKNGSLTGSDLRKGTLTTGPAGVQGPKGDAGATGPAGPVDAFATRVNGSGAIGTTFAPVVTSPVLPAGSYTLTARVNIVGGGGVTSKLICSLADDAAQNFEVTTTNVFPLVMVATAQLTAPEAIGLNCLKSAGTPQAAQAEVIATRVTSLTGVTAP